MSPALWTAIGSVVAALIGAGAAYLVKRIDARSTRETSAVDGYQGLVADLRVQQDRDREDADRRITDLEARDRDKALQLESLKQQLDIVTEDRDGVVAYLKTLWRWVVSGAKPPPPPIPDHLHDVLPPTDYVWPAPTPTFDDTTD